MNSPATITPAIVEALYEDALELSEEARLVFERDERPARLNERQSMVRITMSCEALRVTTRMMHAMAWLLNQRAYFAGQMSEFQLRRHGRLPPPQPESDPADLALLAPHVVDLIERTKAFYARVARLDRAWQAHFSMQPSAVHRLRERLGRAFASG